MAQKLVVELIDDLDGSEAHQTVKFALDSTAYEVDLSDTNATELRSILSRFTEKARRTGGRKQAAAETRTAGPDTKAIRAWALVQGLEINPRGRVPEAIVQQYLAAN
ncbi:Lsr2 family protein [Pseudarthrobacter sp. BIM B-2242]|uniref:histone-like nucleoid-structuring protein Lsr2 n=1 Tax=Pseudarthrobacter sp. BIM B-2242 TaxID=2772401 RepID=UPI00168ACF37|nr:Lsr2 family protein [Pseudarthrobacter sp. BIM B-2242]QOD05783.1 Lsr2 family protein [Pseudarthrobacter sp. BIM B-2242]